MSLFNSMSLSCLHLLTPNRSHQMPYSVGCFFLLKRSFTFPSFLPSFPLLQKHLLIGSHDCCDLLYSLYNIVGSSPYTFKLQYKAPCTVVVIWCYTNNIELNKEKWVSHFISSQIRFFLLNHLIFA